VRGPGVSDLAQPVCWSKCQGPVYQGVKCHMTQGNAVTPPPVYCRGRSLKMDGNGKGNACHNSKTISTSGNIDFVSLFFWFAQTRKYLFWFAQTRKWYVTDKQKGILKALQFYRTGPHYWLGAHDYQTVKYSSPHLLFATLTPECTNHKQVK